MSEDGRRRSTPTAQVSGTVAGWQLGHAIAHGHHGFPGDPLPDGHLGNPADLAFWGSVFDDDVEDPADMDLDDAASVELHELFDE